MGKIRLRYLTSVNKKNLLISKYRFIDNYDRQKISFNFNSCRGTNKKKDLTNVLLKLCLIRNFIVPLGDKRFFFILSRIQ